MPGDPLTTARVRANWQITNGRLFSPKKASPFIAEKARCVAKFGEQCVPSLRLQPELRYVAENGDLEVALTRTTKPASRGLKL